MGTYLPMIVIMLVSINIFIYINVFLLHVLDLRRVVLHQQTGNANLRQWLEEEEASLYPFYLINNSGGSSTL